MGHHGRLGRHLAATIRAIIRATRGTVLLVLFVFHYVFDLSKRLVGLVMVLLLWCCLCDVRHVLLAAAAAAAAAVSGAVQEPAIQSILVLLTIGIK